MRRIFPLLVLLAALLACSFAQLPGTIQPANPPEASPTPLVLLATPTTAPSPTPTEPPLLIPAPLTLSLPAIYDLRMFTEQLGWALTPEGAVFTNNGGKTWSPLLVPLVNLSANANLLFINADTVYVLSPQPDQTSLLSITRDAGKTWQQRPAPFTSSRLSAIAGTEDIYALQSIGAGAGSQPVAVQHIYNNGENFFQPFSHTPGEVEVEGSLPISGDKTGLAFISPERGWISGSRPVENEIYLFRSDDAGVTWQPQPIQPPAEVGAFMAVSYPPIFFQDNNLNGILAVDFYPTDTQNVTRAFYASNDGGETWAPSAQLFPQPGPFFFFDAQTGWVISQNQLIFTADGGTDWIHLPVAFPPRETVLSLSFVSPTSGWIVTQDNTQITRLYQTSDGGSSWMALLP